MLRSQLHTLLILSFFSCLIGSMNADAVTLQPFGQGHSDASDSSYVVIEGTLLLAEELRPDPGGTVQETHRFNISFDATGITVVDAAILTLTIAHTEPTKPSIGPVTGRTNSGFSKVIGEVPLAGLQVGDVVEFDATFFMREALARRETMVSFFSIYRDLFGYSPGEPADTGFVYVFDASRPQGPTLTIVTPTPIQIPIDILPGRNPAAINPKSNAQIPVAILTTNTIDAETINAETVRFGANGTEAAPVRVAVEDVDGNGRADLLLDFRTSNTSIQCGATSASLTGKLFSGDAIHGSDAIQTVGCK
jgi:hypothetical protein